MKKMIITVFAILTIASTSHGSEAKIEACADLEATAMYVMSMRMNEYIMSDTFKECHGQSMCESLVVKAYNAPMPTKTIGRVDFGAKIFEECLVMSSIPDTSGIKKIRD